MPQNEGIINLPEFKIVGFEGFDPIHFDVSFEGKNICPFCSCERLRSKDRFLRTLQHESIGLRRVFIRIRAFKFHCLGCKKYFNQRFPGILPYRRSTEPFRFEVFQKHHSGIAQSSLGKQVGIGTATIERWYQDFIFRRNQELKAALSPKVLGIDEHFFTKRLGYATTLADLGSRRVYDVVLGRSEASLKHYLERLPGKSNTKVIVMDLSETYRSIAKKHFPHALIVADRFHVIRLVNHHFLKTWQLLDPEGKNNRGLLSLIRRHRWNLKPDQAEKLYKYLRSKPGLEAIYDFKQHLNQILLFKHQNQKDCRPLSYQFLSMVSQLKSSGFEHLKRLGETLYNWRDEIARMWRFTKTNSITEGLHNKMEMISRRAFGFRNFNNYRLRVKALCG